MNKVDLQRVLDLDAQATDGPWAPWYDQDGTTHMNGLLMLGNEDAVIPEGETWVEGVDINPIAHFYTPEDRAFVAVARTAAPAMAEALQEVIALHVETGGKECLTCTDERGPKPYPCPTVRAILEHLGEQE